jgi:hypothetical protein
MHAHRNLRGRTPAFPFIVVAFLMVLIASLEGCSSGPAELAGPSRTVVANAPAVTDAFVDAPLEVLDQPVTHPPFAHSKYPRLRVWTDTWRGVRDQGISLEPDHIHDLAIPAGEAVTFYWEARVGSGPWEIIGYRWSLDNPDISDETPRIDDSDLAHWSAWSASETSATVGPFEAGGAHDFQVETRDERGLVSLVTVRVFTDDGAGLVPTRDGFAH